MKTASSYTILWVECPNCGEDFELSSDPPCEEDCPKCGETFEVTE